MKHFGEILNSFNKLDELNSSTGRNNAVRAETNARGKLKM
jgi:hypothetical protein